MSELLMSVGAVVFFISVYGAVMVGGHLLEQLEELESVDPPSVPRSSGDDDQHPAAAVTSPNRH